MTKITIFKKEDKIWAFQAKGHSGYAQSGSDIVCSAVSTAMQMAAVGLKEVLNLDVECVIADGFMKVELKKTDLENESAQIILKTLEKTLSNISKQYLQHVKVEVKKDVY